MRRGLATLLAAVSIGALRQRVIIERAVTIPDAAGGRERNYQPVDSVWAKIEPVAADAALREGQAAQSLSHRIILRWRADIDASCRLVLGSRIFSIQAVADADETRRFLVVLAEEVRP